jgi:hypothetical protein
VMYPKQGAPGPRNFWRARDKINARG